MRTSLHGNTYAALILLIVGACSKPTAAPTEQSVASSQPSPESAPPGATESSSESVVQDRSQPPPGVALSPGQEQLLSKKFRGRQILIAYQGASSAPPSVTRSKAEAQALAKQVRAEIKDTDSFVTQATQHSDSQGSAALGAVSEVPMVRLIRAFGNAAQSLPKDQVSDVLESPFGYHIVLPEPESSASQP
jgi:hypothetical protein